MAQEVLDASQVTARAPSVSVVGDTLFFSASAYRVAEDASLEDLLKKIPGIEISGNKVTLYGKPVSEFRINGKRFFGGDIAMGLQHLSADLVDKVGAYERESDFTRLTGVDDGELVPVLDVRIKPEFLEGWEGRLTGGYGSSGRMVARANASKIDKDEQSTVLAGVNNLPEKASFNNASRTRLGGGTDGDVSRREAGYTYAFKDESRELDWNLQYQGNRSDIQSDFQSQSIYSNGMSYADGMRILDGRRHNPKADIRLKWTRDKQHSFVVKSSVYYNTTDNWSRNYSRNYKADPYGLASPEALSSVLSSTADNLLQSFSQRAGGSLMLLWTRRFAKKGRNFSIQADNSGFFQRSDQASNYCTLYNRKTLPTDTTRRQYLGQYNRNLNLSLKLAWNEPVAKGVYLQLSVRGDYKDRADARSLYDLTRVDNAWAVQNRHSVKGLLASFPQGWENCLQEDVSYTGDYSYWGLTVIMSTRVVRKRYNYTLGLRLNPATQTIRWPSAAEMNSRRASVFYWAPNLAINYNPNKHRKLSASYRSSVNLSSIYNLLPLASGNNALSVHVGNPDLKPSNTHIVRLTYNASAPWSQTSLTADWELRATENAVCNSTSYEPETGVKTRTPRNIGGNWFTQGNMVLAKAFDRAGLSFSSHSSARYDCNSNYLYNKTTRADEMNVTDRAMLKESLRAGYRNRILDVTLDVGGEYTIEHSQLRPDLDQRPWSLVCGLSAIVGAPWGMQLTTDLTLISQRGFVYGDYNHDYCVLNATLSQQFFSKRLTVRLEGSDMLRQLPNLLRSYSAESRSVTTVNGVNSYYLLRFIWKFR